MTTSAVDGRAGIDAALVKRLLAAQFPQWADLPVTPVAKDGWDNRTYRLGTDMTVRLPSGKPPSQPNGTANRAGATATSPPATSLSTPDACPPSSTSAPAASATRPVTSSSPG